MTLCLGLKQLQQQLWCLLLLMPIGRSSGIAAIFLERVRHHFRVDCLQADNGMTVAGPNS